MELRYRWEDGWRDWYLWAESVADETGVVQSLWGTTQDVTAQRAAEAAIRRLAVTDSLTGLANRQALQDRLESALGSGRECGLLLLDLDRFKSVNDTLGHLVGDELLVALGRRLGGFATDGRTVGRLGGDEFLIVVPRGTLDDVRQLAERVLAAVDQPVTVRGHAEPLPPGPASGSPLPAGAGASTPPSSTAKLTSRCTPPRTRGAVASRRTTTSWPRAVASALPSRPACVTRWPAAPSTRSTNRSSPSVTPSPTT